MISPKNRIELTPEEQKIFDEIKTNVEKCRENFRSSYKETILKIKIENAKLCVKLHMSLKKRGIPPIHSKYMIQNRGTSTSESFEFYNHLAPQIDLVKFIKNPQSNIIGVEPDVTMGEKFKFKVYSKRWRYYDTYTLERNADGWHISYWGIGGQCDHRGEPYLYKNFDQDFIAHPKKEVESLLSSIWTRAEGGASKEKVQEYLNKVAEYVSICEKNNPDYIFV